MTWAICTLKVGCMYGHKRKNHNLFEREKIVIR